MWGSSPPGAFFQQFKEENVAARCLSRCCGSSSGKAADGGEKRCGGSSPSGAFLRQFKEENVADRCLSRCCSEYDAATGVGGLLQEKWPDSSDHDVASDGEQIEQAARPHAWNAGAPSFIRPDLDDDGLQDEGEAMADLWDAEVALAGSGEAWQDGPPSLAEVRDAAEEALDDARRRRNDEQEHEARRLLCPMPPPFAPAQKCDGERENRVFETGEAGLGYYIDAGPIQHVNLSDLLHPLEAAPPVPIELVKCVSDTEKRRAPFTAPTPCRRRERPRKAGVVGFEASLHEADAIWPDDGSLSMKSTQHRRKGMFAIDSLNENAWPAAEEYCGQTEADLILIQEAKIAEPELINTEATMRAKGWSVSKEWQWG